MKTPDEIRKVLIKPLQKPRSKLALFDYIRRDLLLAVLLVISVASSGMMIYFWRANSTSSRQAGEISSLTIKNDVEALVANLGEFVVLPDDEEPTIATVTDPELLRGQPFFENAKTGYKVLIYSKAKKAILYDPESKKIVDMAPINLD